jgi:hypothetical protein
MSLPSIISILPEKDERLYHCAVNSVRGIPVIIEMAVRAFLRLEQKGNENISK